MTTETPCTNNQPEDSGESVPFTLRFICCGREDGTATRSTWDEAEALRESYISAEGHDRSCIIEAQQTTLPSYSGSDLPFRYGPFFERIPSRVFVIRPSRSHTVCPLCGMEIDMREAHAVVQERFDGQLVAACYAHLACCERLQPIQEEK